MRQTLPDATRSHERGTGLRKKMIIFAVETPDLAEPEIIQALLRQFHKVVLQVKENVIRITNMNQITIR
jgi:hypothetical protein